MAKKKTNQTVVETIGPGNEKNFSELMRNNYLGQQIVLIAARYQYWGIVSKVTDDCIVLAQAVAVQRSGSAQDDKPDTIDVIGSSIIIKHDAIELVFFPKWVGNPLPGTE
jgi:hypothetical protein